ncbi:MAG TPA: DUF2304 domain-containing protein [bacterium]|jgi:hypothetical protein|nr:DUF2304 domain-containing protein [bacterium]HOC25461.1 DUF2304 domain-containing protein [bacterium]HOH06596.1 DUF2304 domain-containing protein [bacterium]HOY45367.1 DUF2304 domain-containing protein [bacterium]HPG82780.1 DUF2304 domain-containing protein [bacterium]
MPDTAHGYLYGNRILYLSIAAGLIFLIFIVQLVRQRKLSERFALVWMVIPILLILFSSNRALLERLAQLAGIAYAPALMIPIIFGLFTLVSLYFSVKASKSEQQIKKLAQELALLRHAVQQSPPVVRDRESE